MRLLLDNGLPRSTADHLRAEGFDATHVGVIGLAGAADAVLLDHARNDGSIVVTLDADFHTLLAMSGAKGPSVIRVRIEGLGGSAMAGLIGRVARRFADELREGAAISVGPRSARCHLLPIGMR